MRLETIKDTKAELINRVTVTGLITYDEIESWKNGDIVTINAGMNTGKSHFVKHRLTIYAKQKGKKILMLVPRIDILDEFKREIESEGKQDIIDVRTYQSMEMDLIKNKDTFLNEYAYIVNDEFHYYINDASFGDSTDLSLDAVLKCSSAVKIFMSATGNDIVRYLKAIEKIEIKKEYVIDANYDYIRDIKFYEKDETVEDMLNHWIETGEKAIIFIYSAKKAYNLYKKFKEYSAFNCSKYNKDYAKYISVEEKDRILSENKFETQFLITTSAMDAGVNIWDNELVNVVVDIKDPVTLIQCVGRKRVKYTNEYINLYVKNVCGKRLGGMKSKLTSDLTMADFLKKNGIDAFEVEYHRKFDKNSIIYIDRKSEDVYQINKLKYVKAKMDLVWCGSLISRGKYAYREYILELFKKATDKIVTFEREKEEDKIGAFLEANKGKYIYGDLKEELINVLNLKDDRGRLQKKISTINGYLIDNYRMTAIVDRPRIDGKKTTVWIISDIA